VMRRPDGSWHDLDDMSPLNQFNVDAEEDSEE
jgi:hypothetical protein